MIFCLFLFFCSNGFFSRIFSQQHIYSPNGFVLRFSFFESSQYFFALISSFSPAYFLYFRSHFTINFSWSVYCLILISFRIFPELFETNRNWEQEWCRTWKRSCWFCLFAYSFKKKKIARFSFGRTANVQMKIKQWENEWKSKVLQHIKCAIGLLNSSTGSRAICLPLKWMLLAEDSFPSLIFHIYIFSADHFQLSSLLNAFIFLLRLERHDEF